MTNIKHSFSFEESTLDILQKTQQLLPNLLYQLLIKINIFSKNHNLVKTVLSLDPITRKDLIWGSNLNLCLILEKGSTIEVLNDLQVFFSDMLFYTINLPKKLILYFKTEDKYSQTQIVKTDLFLVESIEEIIKNLEELFLTINDPKNIILLDKDKETTIKISNILNKIKEPPLIIKERVFLNLHSFIDAFDHASRAHALRDSYHFYFNINIAYHYLLMLRYILTGNVDSIILPKNMYTILFRTEDRANIESLEPKSDLRIAHNYKEKLMKNLLQTLEGLQDKYKIDLTIPTIQILLENILERYYFLNFRDTSLINTKIMRKNVLYRSSTLSRYIGSQQLDELTNLMQWKTIIDLRFKEEQEKYPYGDFMEKYHIYYVNIPIAPRKVNEPMLLRFLSSDDTHVTYEVNLRYCHDELAKIFTALAKEPVPMLVHCHSGKDRTGIVVALLQDLLGLTREEIIEEYMNSGKDTTKKAIETVFKVVDEQGGIRKFLNFIGVSDGDKNTLQDRYQNP